MNVACLHHVTASLIGACAAGAFAATAAAEEITVGAFGGLWEQSLRECVVAPFEAATGHTVNVVLGAPVQWMNQIAASPNDPPLDVIYMPSDNAFDVVDRGLAEQFTLENVPNMASLPEAFQTIGDGYGVVHNYGSMGLIYNTETVSEPPASWEDFIEGVAEGEWYASIPGVNYPGALSTGLWNFANLAGGGLDDIEPGFETIERMQEGGSLEFWSDPNQVLNGLRSGAIDIAMYWDGRALAFIDDGNENFAYVTPSPGAVAAMTWIQKVTNSSDVGWEFVNAALDAEAQGCFGSRTRYGVGNASAEFDPAVRDQITKFDELVFPPFREMTEVQSLLIDQWNRRIGR